MPLLIALSGCAVVGRRLVWMNKNLQRQRIFVYQNTQAKKVRNMVYVSNMLVNLLLFVTLLSTSAI